MVSLSSIIAPIPCSGIEHIRGQDVVDYSNDVVSSSSESDGLDLEPSGRHLSHERVADLDERA